MTYNCRVCAEQLTQAPIKTAEGWFFYCTHCGELNKIIPVFQSVKWG